MPRGISTVAAAVAISLTVRAQARAGDSTTPPVLLQTDRPQYTKEATSRRVEGRVVARCHVGTDGLVSGCTVVEHLPGLDESAVKTLESRRYAPALKDGIPVAVDALLDVRFELPPVLPDGGRQPACVVVSDLVGGGSCSKACWNETGAMHCEKQACCPDGCAAERLPPEGKCWWPRPRLCAHFIAPVAAAWRAHASCAKDEDCEKHWDWFVDGLAANHALGESCWPETLAFPFQGPTACVEGLCATTGTPNPAGVWDAFVEEAKRLDAERLAKGQLLR